MSIPIIHTRLVPVKEPPDNPRLTDDATLQTEFLQRLAGVLADRQVTITAEAVAGRMTPQDFLVRTSALWDVADANGITEDVARLMTLAWS